jgi:hypothetical protein
MHQQKRRSLPISHLEHSRATVTSPVGLQSFPSPVYQLLPARECVELKVHPFTLPLHCNYEIFICVLVVICKLSLPFWFLQAYYRRATANMALGKFKLALKDFEAVSVSCGSVGNVYI